MKNTGFQKAKNFGVFRVSKNFEDFKVQRGGGLK